MDEQPQVRADLRVITCEIARLKLNPDDTLVVRVRAPIDGTDAARIKDIIRTEIGHQRVLVMDDQVDMQVLGPEK